MYIKHDWSLTLTTLKTCYTVICVGTIVESSSCVFPCSQKCAVPRSIELFCTEASRISFFICMQRNNEIMPHIMLYHAMHWPVERVAKFSMYEVVHVWVLQSIWHYNICTGVHWPLNTCLIPFLEWFSEVQPNLQGFAESILIIEVSLFLEAHSIVYPYYKGAWQTAY